MFKVCNKRCDQCLFSAQKIVSDERRDQIIKDCLRTEAHFICHKHTIADSRSNVCCRGFYDTYPNATQAMQIATRLGFIEWVEYPQKGNHMDADQFLEVVNLRRKSDGEPYVAKKVRICDLADGWFREKLTMMTIDQQQPVWVCGKPGSSDDWAAYIGHPDLSNVREDFREELSKYLYARLTTPDGVISRGDKLFEEEARPLFPEYDHLRYRR